MNIRRIGLLLALPLLTAACERSDQLDELEISEEAYETPTQAADGMTPEEIPARSLYTLGPGNESGVTGDVAARANGTSTELVANLIGLSPGESILGHVHEGSCGALPAGSGGVAEFGPAVVEDEGTVEFIVPIAVEELTSGGYAVAFHQGDSKSHIACADLGETMQQETLDETAETETETETP